MKKQNLRLLLIALAVAIVCMTPIVARAAVTEDEMAVINKGNNEYIIYIEKYLNTEFKYAFTTDNSLTGDKLAYETTVDDKGNNIAYISDASLYGENAIYMFVKTTDENGVPSYEKTEVKLTNEKVVISDSELSYVEDTSSRIPVLSEKNGADLYEEYVIDEDGVEKKITRGVVHIDKSAESYNENAKYQYILIKISEDSSKNEYNLMKLAEYTSESEEYKAYYQEYQDDYYNGTAYSSLNIFDKTKSAIEFLDLYNEIIEEANSSNSWLDVTVNENGDLEIAEPEDTKTGDEYMIFLKKSFGNTTRTIHDNENTTYDAHFLICGERHGEVVENEPIKTEKKVVKKVRLPITADNLTLYVIIAVIAVALILVFIRIKRLENKSRRRHGKHSSR